MKPRREPKFGIPWPHPDLSISDPSNLLGILLADPVKAARALNWLNYHRRYQALAFACYHLREAKRPSELRTLKSMLEFGKERYRKAASLAAIEHIWCPENINVLPLDDPNGFAALCEIRLLTRDEFDKLKSMGILAPGKPVKRETIIEERNALRGLQPAPPHLNPDRFIRWKDIKNRVPYSRTYLGRLMRANRFPKPYRFPAGYSAWLDSEFEQWHADFSRRARSNPIIER